MKVTKKQFQEELERYFPNQIEILEWNGLTQPITYRCKKCGEIYHKNDARKLRSCMVSCEKCYEKHRWKKEEVQKRINQIWNNGSIEILNFDGLNHPVKIKCNICGNIETIQFGRTLFSRKRPCGVCADNPKNKIHKQVIELAKQNNMTLIQWNGTNQKMKVRCNSCGQIFERWPNNFIKAPDVCYWCSNNGGFGYTKDKVQERVNAWLGNNDYEILEYKEMRKPALIRHKCGLIFSQQIHNFVRGRGCPKCYATQSRYERKVRRYLDSNNINYDVQVRFKDCNEGRSSYDFKIYNKDSTFFLCEVQGEQHYKDILFLGGLEYNQSRDKIKRDYCEKKGIKLIEIPYYDIDNLDKYFK